MKAFFVLLATVVFAISNMVAATDYLLELDGIKGEVIYSGPLKANGTITVPADGSVTKVKIKNAQGIEVMSWSFGASNPTSVNSFSWGVSQNNVSTTSPRDAASGLPTGSRQPPISSTGVETGSNARSAPSTMVVSPRDAASGLPTGKRMHKPFVITKELDKSSPVARVDDTAFTSANLAIKFEVSGTVLTYTCNPPMIATYDLAKAKKM